MEAVEFGGHQKLDNLILIYDANAVTLDAMAKVSQSENTAERLDAMGFDVITIDGNDMDAFHDAYERAKEAGSGKPQAHHRQDAHRQGHPRGRGHQQGARRGRREVRRRGPQGTRPAGGALLRVPGGDGIFRGPEEVARREVRRVGQEVRRLEGRQPEAGRRTRRDQRLQPHRCRRTPSRKTPVWKNFSPSSPSSRRTARSPRARPVRTVLQPLAKQNPLLIGGSADLYGSTLNYIGDLKARDDDFSPANRKGRNIPFGIREHGMCSIMNGIAAHGVFRPSGATFLVFADYCRAAIRLAALVPSAGHLHLHARQRRRRRGRPDPSAHRDDPGPAHHHEPRRGPPRRPRGNGGRVRRRPGMATFGKCLRRLLFDDTLRADMAAAARTAGMALPRWPDRARQFAALLEQNP